MSKKRMKGLKGFRFWEEIENNDNTYNTGAVTLFPYATEISESVESSENPIYADDTKYDDGYEESGIKYTVTFAELPQSIKAKLKGYAVENGVLKVSRNPQRPSIGFSFARKMLDGNYRMFKHFGASVTQIEEISGTTDRKNNSGSDVKVTFSCTGREMDDQFYYQKESTGNDLSWLDDTTGSENLGILTVFTTEGSASGKCEVSVKEGLLSSGNKFVYLTGSAVTFPDYLDVIDMDNLESNVTGGDLPSDGEITATNGNAVIVIEVDSNNKALRAGGGVIQTPTA